ncbi:CYIR protein, partial [Plasmodium cynomolgi strain B]
MGTVTVIFENKIQTVDLDKCWDIHSEIVRNIEVKISEFEGMKCEDFKNQLEKLITYIENERETHKECYTRQPPYPNLDDDEYIKHFYRICNAKTNCNYISAQYKKLIELKDDTGISCESDQDSVIKNVEELKGKSDEAISQPNEKVSKIITSEINDSQSGAHNSNPLNGNAHDWQAVGSQTDEDHLFVDKDVAVFFTTKYRAAETSISGKPGDRSYPLISTNRADDFMISISFVGTPD